MARIEKDFLGEKELPDTAYYGVQTLRGKEEFPHHRHPDGGRAVFRSRTCRRRCCPACAGPTVPTCRKATCAGPTCSTRRSASSRCSSATSSRKAAPGRSRCGPRPGEPAAWRGRDVLGVGSTENGVLWTGVGRGRWQTWLTGRRKGLGWRREETGEGRQYDAIEVRGCLRCRRFGLAGHGGARPRQPRSG